MYDRRGGLGRTPSDGFMRLQALAFARISHFGIQEANTELVLRVEEGTFNGSSFV